MTAYRFRRSWKPGNTADGGVRKIILACCNALSVLHENGFVHRDIKPENILVTPDGRVVLLDFNAARKIRPGARDTQVLGTVGYAPPEQYGIAASDERADIYALGVLMNILLTGRHPSDRLAKGKAGRIIRKCTQINPADRFQSVRQIAEQLSFGPF